MINNALKIEPFIKLSECLDKEQYEDLLQEVSLQNFKKGQEIFSEYSKPLGLYSVEEGLVKLTNRTDHRFVLFNVLKSKEIFNYQPLLTGSNNTHTAIAIKDTVIAILPKEKFINIYNNEKTVRDMVLSLLIEDVKLYHEKVLILSFNTIRIKLAMAFLYLNKIYKESGKDGIILNRQELADFTGTTRETIIRIAKDFEREDLINIIKGNIQVKDRDALQKLIDIELNA